MDEQLEVTLERGAGEVLPEAAVSPADEEGSAQKAAEAGKEDVKEEMSSRGEDRVPARKETAADAPSSPSELRDGDPGRPSPCGEGGEALAETDEVTSEESSPRNYYAEWQELAEAHPEVVGKELPEDIYQACMRSELPPLRVYESMMLQKQAEQISALQQEIATLRQNAENTARAPVSAAAGGPDSEPEDLFLKGFNSY